MSEWVRYSLIGLLVVGGLAIVGVRRRESLARLVPHGRGGGSVRMATSVLGWLVIGLLVAAATAGGLLWLLGWPRFPSTQAFGVDQMLDLLKIALSVVAGFGGVVLLAVNYRKQRVTEAEHVLAVERGEREEVQGFNERFGASAEQLAHDRAAVRLAGVYAMAGLADDWADKRQVCIDVLCGYLRLAPVDATGESQVCAAVLRVFRERLDRNAEFSLRAVGWHHLDFDFTGVEFDEADFQGLVFAGKVVFDSAKFTGKLTTFGKTSFKHVFSCRDAVFGAERTTFAEVVFVDAQAEFVGADFSATVPDFSGMVLAGRSVRFQEVAFAGRVDFSDLTVSGGTFSFIRCVWEDCELDLSLLNKWHLIDISDWFGGRTPGVGHFVLDQCRFVRGVVDFTEVSDERPGVVWLRRCSFDSVELKFSPPSTREPKPWLNVGSVDLVDTELPEPHLRR